MGNDASWLLIIFLLTVAGLTLLVGYLDRLGPPPSVTVNDPPIKNNWRVGQIVFWGTGTLDIPAGHPVPVGTKAQVTHVGELFPYVRVIFSGAEKETGWVHPDYFGNRVPVRVVE